MKTLAALVPLCAFALARTAHAQCELAVLEPAPATPIAHVGYSVAIDGKVIHPKLDLEENPAAIERLVFRTGPWRMDVPPVIVDRGEPGAPGVFDGDRPGADAKVPASVYLIDDIKTENL